MTVPGLRRVGPGELRSAPANRAEDRHPGGREERRQAWADALDVIEADTHHAERTLAGASAAEIAAWGRRSSDWVPPTGLGPMPADLRERAARLLQHQLAVAEALVEGIVQSRRQRDVAARMSQSPSRPESSFIDRPV
ncbi:hypothetical protein [Geodermatophilus sp. Leaf369]|uniref:hypothetical protein n=1 Tax=Geodermatophilus sp. Leaf369 TaxID=1736354 RepID=UPI001F1A11F4|nr:hypothetical protein [Geodermatophilus sp. Leaf369]